MKPAYLELTAATVTASASERTITGRIMEYGAIGYASLGPCIFERGSITAPEPLSKSKLLIQHDTERSVGYLKEITESGNWIDAVFAVPAGPEGDDALTKASNGVRDSFSVGVHLTEYTFDDDGNLIVKASTLKETSLVTIPAFENALVQDVAANRKETIMTVEEMNAARQAAQAAPAAEPETVAASAVPAERVLVAERQPAPVTPAPRQGLTLAAASRLVADHLQAGNPATALTAALSDVVPADDAGQGFLRKDFIGELWQAQNDDRPLIDAFGPPKELKSTKVYGWKWDLANSPKIARYAGNKSDVASNPLKTVPVESDAQDFAAGWDVARKYIDLGAADYIESVFQGATADYRRQTELWFGEQILADATEVVGVTTVLQALTEFNVRAAQIGARVNVLQFGTDAWEQFIGLTDAQVPWWLKAQGSIEIDGLKGKAGGMTFSANPGLAPGRILGADKRAASYYEHKSSPIRITAQDIPRGGVDLGVFGYAGQITHDPRAIWISDDGIA